MLSPEEVERVKSLWEQGSLGVLGREFGVRQEVMVLYGQNAFPGTPELLKIGVVDEGVIGFLEGIRPGVVVLTQISLDRSKPLFRFLAGVLERDDDESSKFRLRHFLRGDIRVPWLLIQPEDGEMSQKFPYRIYWDFGGGGKESLGYRHFVISEERWRQMEAFFDKWLPVA